MGEEMKLIQNTHPARKTITTSVGMLPFGEKAELPDPEADYILSNEHGVEVLIEAKPRSRRKKVEEIPAQTDWVEPL